MHAQQRLFSCQRRAGEDELVRKLGYLQKREDSPLRLRRIRQPRTRWRLDPAPYRQEQREKTGRAMP